MKKIVCILLVFVLTTTMLCGCNNQGEAQSNTSDEVIIIEEEVVYEGGSVSTDSTDENLMSSNNNSLSGESEVPSNTTIVSNTDCSHKYNETIKQSAELFKVGVKSYTCANCGDSYEKTFPLEKIKILSISNSYGKNALWELYSICKQEGVKEIDIAVMYIAGCSIDAHWENIQNNNAVYEVFRNNNGSWESTVNRTVEELLSEGDWDIITTQNSSGLSGKTDGFKNLNNVVNYIKDKCPNSKILWHMIWAYQNGSKWLDTTYNNDENFMYKKIVECVKSEVEPKIEYIVPVGAAIMNARTSSLKDDVHLDDGSHLSEDFGYYVAAYTWYCYITGQSPYDTAFAAGSIISGDKLNIVLESAKNALENPYQITQSYYTN